MKLHPAGAYFYLLCVESLLFAKSASEEQKLNVGFIIEGESQSWALAFQKATEAANQTLADLLAGQPHQVRLVPLLKRIEVGNAFAATKAACELLKEPVVAIIGPNSNAASLQVLRVSQKHGIPYMVTRWGDEPHLNNVSVDLHPSGSAVGQTLRRFVEEAEEWKQLGLIYTEDEGLQKFENLLSRFKGDIIMRKWDHNDLFHKYVIKYFRTTMSQFRFVVDIPQSEIPEFLDLIAEYNMTSQYYSYIFTDWDTQFLNPKSFAIDRGANFSTLSLINLTWLHEHLQQGSRFLSSPPPKGVLRSHSEPTSSQDRITNYLLILDALHLLAVGIARIISTTSRPLEPPVGVNCDVDTAWVLGPKLVQTMKSENAEVPSGFTGRMEFNELGRRKNMNITVWEISKDGFQEYGYYNEKDDIVVTKRFATTQAQIQKELKGQTLRVTTIEDKPFVMYKGQLTANGEKSIDPKDWHGFCIDLLNECAAALQFNYTVHPVADGTYGSATIINGIEVWDGIIGELQFKKADLAVAMLTINYEREKVIDFTTPFMNLGVSIIFKKPVGQQPDLFAFLRPLSPTVWGYVLIAYVGVSMALFFVGRFSPYEWHNPHPCNADSELLENTFNMLNSLWFTIGSLMQQGSDILPRATSTRIVSGFWWFFTLIIISSYTANLAAFLTVERMKVPIEDVNDLAKQTKIKYGTRDGGSSAAFFEKSNVSTYQRMWQFMSSHKNVMMNNTEEAIARVKRGGYAYILESTINEYYTQRDCELMQVGNNLDSKGYGIGFPQGM
uniref:Glutamate receptor ionotropic, kainate 2 n=1 Tax=Schistocephalus solidus TaxID=70667 RepID=A0A0X3NGZ5_SCHSO